MLRTAASLPNGTSVGRQSPNCPYGRLMPVVQAVSPYKADPHWRFKHVSESFWEASAGAPAKLPIMMQDDSTSAVVTNVLARYPADCRPLSITALGGAGGFSGAELWRLQTPRGPACLRKWPAQHPSLERLQLIHATLLHVHAKGFERLPTPWLAADGATIVSAAAHFWQLEPWLPGEADFHSGPTPAGLSAAITALAQFHVTAAGCIWPNLPAVGVSPTIAERIALVDQLRTGGLAELQRASVPRDWSELAARGPRILAAYRRMEAAVDQQLRAVSHCQLRLQPCLRDIWHDHVLFTGEQVSGLVDVGAMRWESPAVDVARLLPSLVGDDPALFALGLQAYQSVRRLDASELQVIAALNESSVALSGIRWLQWIRLEDRQFADHGQVLARLDEILVRAERRFVIVSPANFGA